MIGNHITLGKEKVLITQPQLWRDCISEQQYFQILRIKQQKARSTGFPSFKLTKYNR
jgi:hypothetical protein